MLNDKPKIFVKKMAFLYRSAFFVRCWCESDCSFKRGLDILRLCQNQEEQMVLKFEYDPLDHEQARGHWYHVCLGRVEEKEMMVPPPGETYECPRCGVELEAEDFWVAQQRGSV